MMLEYTSPRGKFYRWNISSTSAIFYEVCVQWIGEEVGKKEFFRQYERFCEQIEKNELTVLRKEVEKGSNKRNRIEKEKECVYWMLIEEIKVSDIVREVLGMAYGEQICDIVDDILFNRSALRVLKKLRFCNRSNNLMKKFLREYKKYVVLKKEMEKVGTERNFMSMSVTSICVKYSNNFCLGLVEHVIDIEEEKG